VFFLFLPDQYRWSLTGSALPATVPTFPSRPPLRQLGRHHRQAPTNPGSLERYP